MGLERARRGACRQRCSCSRAWHESHVSQGPILSAYNIFESMGTPGVPDVAFDKVARWSMRQQWVRPGSGALVPQKRFLAHMIDPSSVGLLGTYNSARCRKPGGERRALTEN